MMIEIISFYPKIFSCIFLLIKLLDYEEEEEGY
jgi:hypothetical protein